MLEVFMKKLVDQTYNLTSRYYGKEPCTQVLYETNTVRVGKEKYVEGYPIPYFHKLVRSGALLPYTSWYRSELETAISTSSCYVNTTSGSCSCNPCRVYWAETFRPWTTSPRSPMLDYVSMKNLCTSHLGEGVSINTALAKVYDKGWDALTFIAELKSTYRMFGSLIQRFNSGFTSRCRGRKNAHDWESYWLEWRYGWRTLYFDIRDFIKVVQRLDKGIERFRASDRNEWTDSSSTTTPISHSVFDAVIEETVIIKYSTRESVTLDVRVPKFWLNPITTAWEVIPYSFVVDWFINVGDYLKAMSILALSTGGVAGQGIRVDYTRIHDFHVTGDKAAYGYTWHTTFNYVYKTQGFGILRAPIDYSIDKPQFSVNLNTQRIVDAVALLKQVFK